MANDQYTAKQPLSSSNRPPEVFAIGQPPSVYPGLTSYQLALADKLMQGTVPPFGINPDFLRVMNTFSSSKILTPATQNPKTGETVQPPFAPGITGNSYILIGQTIYVIRQAQECGPNGEERYEKVAVENLANVAIRTWQYYGDAQPSGSASDGTGQLGPI